MHSNHNYREDLRQRTLDNSRALGIFVGGLVGIALGCFIDDNPDYSLPGEITVSGLVGIFVGGTIGERVVGPVINYFRR